MMDKSPIPTKQASDSEDVAWALSTAETQWARGDHAEAIKWLRRAVESASEAQDDDRALALAKAAADLASQAGVVPTSPPPPVVVRPSAPPAARASAPPSGRPSAPPAQSKAPPPVPSRPPPPVASRPPPPVASKPPPAPSRPSAPPRAPAEARVAPTTQPRAATTATGARAPIPVARPAAGVPAKPAGRRKSKENLAEEAQQAAKLAPAPPVPTPLAPGDVTITHAGPDEITQQIQTETKRRRSKPAAEETHEVVHAPVSATTDEMDAWPTQSLGGDAFAAPDEKTRIGEPAYQASAQRSADASPPSHALVASQAVRVVVWRGADGVRIAPYGTTVNAIGVDAILVALDPNADLATWLSRK